MEHARRQSNHSLAQRTMNATLSTALLAILVAGTAAAAPDAVPNSPSAQVDTGTLEEIVVTARRRSEDLQNVPGQVTAVTASDLAQMHARSFEDFAAFVPGLSYQSASPATNLIAIRGITTGGSQLSSAIGLYLDEIPLGASTSFGLGYQSYDVNVFDLDRVEVLNGPQGTLYGASSLGGALKYITAVPNPTHVAATGEAEVSSTEHGGVNNAVRGMVNLPIGAGLGAVRIDAIDQYDSGYLRDPIFNRRNQGSARTTGGRVSLLLTPTSELSVRLSAFTQRTESNGFDFALRDPVTRAPTLGTYAQAFPLFQPAKSALTVYSGVINWDTSWARLTSITGYQINHGRSLTDVSEIYDPLVAAFGAGSDAFSLPVDTTTKRFTQEIRLASHESKQFEWLAGAYFDHERTLESVDLFDASNAGGALFGVIPFNSVLPSTYRELAGYLDGTVYFTDRFDLALGARYSQNRQTYDETVFGLFATGSSAVSTPPEASSTQSVVTYLINPRYRMGDNSILYVRIASGFRPGGPNFVLKPGLGNPTFTADTLWNYELGEKYTFLEKKASLDVDVFDIQWKDIQLTVNNGGVNQLENAGNARVRGAELAFNYCANPALTLGGSMAYTDARLTTAAPVIGIKYTGARLPLSPRFNFALLGTYNFNINADYRGALTVTDRYVGDRTAGYAGSAVSPLYVLRAYNTVDLGLSIYAPYGLEIDLFAKNLFGVAGEVSASTLANEYNPAAPVPVEISLPRTIGLALKMKVP
jgi:outer membrane receptor protein involved in Fe transport